MDSEEESTEFFTLNEITIPIQFGMTRAVVSLGPNALRRPVTPGLNEIMTRMGGFPPDMGPPRSSLSGCQ